MTSSMLTPGDELGRHTGVDARAVRPIGGLEWRTRATIEGKIRSMRVQPWADVASLECVLVDDTGGVLLVFLGRRKVAGIELGRRLRCEGMVGEQRGYLAILCPDYELLAS